MTKIKKYGQLAFWISVKSKILKQFKNRITKINHYYKNLTRHQRLCIAAIISIILLAIITFTIFHTNKISTSNKPNEARFDTNIPIRHSLQSQKLPPKQNNTFKSQINNEQPLITNQIKELSEITNEKIYALQSQLQHIEDNLNRLASHDDIQQLQNELTQPNQFVTSKLNNLQNTIKKIADQTAQKTWIDPKKIEHYFHLVAIQGFSDGMRAIIDIDENQATLGFQETCPACHGWVLKTMNFQQQSAIFYKRRAHQILYVQLHAN